MTSERLEVVEGIGGWIVSDERRSLAIRSACFIAAPRAPVAVREGVGAGTSVEVHLWHGGKDTIVHFAARRASDQ